MKEITISLWELTKEEAAKVPTGKEILICNTFLNTYRVERSGKGCIARSRYAAPYLKYFIFNRDDCDK